MSILMDPVDDDRRQRAIEGLQVLDTLPEERFDRITALAREVFDVPISTVTLLDRDRAWFKSCAGIDVRDHRRQDTFCARTVQVDEPVVVEDATQHPSFSTLPTVAGPPGIRFYAGFPVHDAHGVAVGTFCLFDTRPRTLPERELRVAAQLAAWVEQELTRSDEMARARAVQQSLLPRSAPEVPGYDAAAACVPASAVAGDFFDYQRVGTEHAFSVADVMGKGTAAAIVTATVRAVLRSEQRAADRGLDGRGSISTTIEAVNAALTDDLVASGAFVTGVFARADAGSGTVRYVDAGHGLVVHVHGDGSWDRPTTTDLPLGVLADWRWTERSLHLEVGDTLLVFSDGLFDAMGGTLDSLAEIATVAHAAEDASGLVRSVMALAARHDAFDDVTVLAVRRTGDA